MSNVRDTGGAAFPREDYQADNARGQRGMTMRDYFAAHAPKRAWNQFHPVMPPRPEPDWTGIDEDARWDASPNNWREIDAWKSESLRQTELQWPYFYADAMLAERAK